MNPGNILCRNVRGLNSRARQDSVRTLVSSAKIDIVCLQEKKCQRYLALPCFLCFALIFLTGLIYRLLVPVGEFW